MRTPILAAMLAALAALPASALTIQIDYTYDTFFSTNATAKATLEKAAADLSHYLGATTISAVPVSSFTGVNGDSMVTIDWGLSFQNPSLATSVIELSNFSSAADTITIYAGMMPLQTGALGIGGPVGASYTLTGSGSSATWAGAVNAAVGASNAGLSRDGGAVAGSFDGSSTLGSATAEYSLAYGILGGVISFDNDTNNDGVADGATALAQYWNFDYNLTSFPGKNDFYSVALHEMMHALGLGASDSWDELVSGTTWLGENAIALTGIGTSLVSLSGDHIAPSVKSTSLFNGALQEVAMDPSQTVGTRKYMTHLDLAFMEDLGYTAVPEPGTLALIALAAALGCAIRPRRV